MRRPLELNLPNPTSRALSSLTSLARLSSLTNLLGLANFATLTRLLVHPTLRMMLPADMCLLWDRGFKKYVMEYKNDEDEFRADFAKAFSKLLELGVPFASA